MAYKYRTVYFIDVGQLPKAKAEEYVAMIKTSFLSETYPNESKEFIPIRGDGSNSRVDQLIYEIPDGPDAKTLEKFGMIIRE